jgi:hypothetical protein
VLLGRALAILSFWSAAARPNSTADRRARASRGRGARRAPACGSGCAGARCGARAGAAGGGARWGGCGAWGGLDGLESG